MTIKELQLRSELEALTGIYADSILSDAIMQEYVRQTDDGHNVWSDKQTFCAAYKENKDGLAEKIQRAANEKIWSTGKNHLDAMTVSAERAHVLSNMQQTADNRIKELEAELEDLKAYCAMIQEKQEHDTEIIQNLTKDKSALVAALKESNIRISQMQTVDSTKLKAKMFDVICWMRFEGYDTQEIICSVITAFSKLEEVMKNA